MMMIIFYLRLGYYKPCSSLVGEIGDRNLQSSFSFLTFIGLLIWVLGKQLFAAIFPFKKRYKY